MTTEANQAPAKNTWGGKREGSGRKKADAAVRAASDKRFAAQQAREAEQRAASESPQPETQPDRDYVAIAAQYIDDVLSGRRVACQWVKLACARQRKDLERSASDAIWPYHFDRDEANRLCAVMEKFPHIKGRWAARKELLHLEPWQCFKTTTLLGWRHRSSNKRRFRQAYICVPRKNAKSTWAAALGNALLVEDGEHGAEIYSGATSEKQAYEVFGPARLMWEKSPKLLKKYGIEVYARGIVKLSDMSKFWPIIGKPGDGASPSLSIHDEYHEHPTSEQVDTMETGMGAREQPLLLIITTAGVSLASPCYDKQQEAQKVLLDVFENDQLFAIIYSVDLEQGKPGDADFKPGDDWTDPKALQKANPNIGVSADLDYLLAQQRNAVLNPVYQNRFKTKHLNLWCSASVAGINMHHWKLATDLGLALDEFKGAACWAILDLASKTDICAYVKLFMRMLNGERHYYAFGKFYLPEQTIEETKVNQKAYEKWVAMSRLIATDGAEIDFDLIREEVKADSSSFQIDEVVYDPWRATQLSHQLAKDGAKVVEIGQTARNMGEAFDEFLSALKGGRFHHDGCPVLEWMASNVVARPAAKGVVVPGKDKLENKIDGIVAIVMGISRALASDPGGNLNEWLRNPVVVST